MYTAIKETINPNGGHGAMEALIFIILGIVVIGAIALNLTDHTIDPLIQTIATGLMGYIGYLVGSNRSTTWTGEERRETNEIDTVKKMLDVEEEVNND